MATEMARFWELEFELARVADQHRTSRRMLVEEFDSLSFNVQAKVKAILEEQVKCLNSSKMGKVIQFPRLSF
jgi:hypothetical protein